MKYPVTLFGALGIGAGLMYFLDPDRGKRRRALAKDRALHFTKTANRELSKKSADLRNRAQGVWFEAEKLFEDETVTDDQLLGRIRSRLGRLTTHPHAVKTAVENGKVILSGLILADELETVLNGVGAICGVREVENRLEAHESAENISSLQGAGRAETIKRRKSRWSPRRRILAAAAGGGLALLGATKTNLANSLLASLGIGLMVRSAANKPLNKLLSAAGEEAIEVHKTINIAAAPERVFEVLKHPQYFPNFMSHVREVTPLDDKRFHWTVDGIGGLPVSWETKITEVVPNELIRWENAGDETNGQFGKLQLEPTADGATRLHVEMNYQPLGGKLGHFVAEIFSRDPKSEMDDDLLRMKTFIEKGKLPRDAAVNLSEKRRKEMKVQEIMTANPVFCTDTVSLHDAAQMMAEYNCGAIPVVQSQENKKPIGMITDRDITIRTVAHNKNPLEMVVGEVMTDNPITVTAEMSIEECCQLMEKNQVRRVPVVDEAGTLCGIVAQADIARKAPGYEVAELVKDISLESYEEALRARDAFQML